MFSGSLRLWRGLALCGLTAFLIVPTPTTLAQWVEFADETKPAQ